MVKREDCVKIGEIGKTHNLQGALVVYTDNDLLEQYMDEPVFIFLEGAPVPFYIAEDGLTERNHSSYIVKFDFVDSKEQADRLVGCDLLMDKYLLEEENELPFELSDLIGYSVSDELTGKTGVVLLVICHRQYSFQSVISFFMLSIFRCAASCRKLSPVKRTGTHMESRRS